MVQMRDSGYLFLPIPVKGHVMMLFTLWARFMIGGLICKSFVLFGLAMGTLQFFGKTFGLVVDLCL